MRGHCGANGGRRVLKLASPIRACNRGVHTNRGGELAAAAHTRQMGDEDDKDVGDESVYDLDDSASRRKAREEEERAGMLVGGGWSAVEDAPRPSWSQQWKEKKEVVRLTGTCAVWNKGYGFLSRSDGAADIYVHQRNVQARGYRSLQVGEAVEFELGVMDDGKLQAVKVTGPGGADVKGQKRRDDDEAEEEADEEAGGLGPVRAKEEAMPKLKPYTAFKPRTVGGAGAKEAPLPLPGKRAAIPLPKPRAPAPAAAADVAATTASEAHARHDDAQ